MRTRHEHYYEFGPFRLEPGEGRLLREGLLVPLTPKAFAMLLLLVRSGGRLVEKEFLMQELWPDAFVEEANLTFTISVVRKALGDRARTGGYIETVPKRGYRFAVTVREVLSEHEVKSLAVLPFASLSPGERSQQFADGIQDALISELAQIRSLRVISRTSSQQYKSGGRPLPTFARALQLDIVVEGSVQLEGDRVRISVRLIDALDDRLVWAEAYDRHLRDVLSWQSEVARSITRQIEISLTPQEDERLRGARAVDPDAHAAFLRGRYYWHRSFTEEAFRAAIGQFGRATDLEPGYARAWSGLADCYSAMAVQSIVPAREAAREATQAAERALVLDPSLPDAHVSMAAIHLFFDRDWTAAERALRNAIQLSPSHSQAHGLFTHYAAARGWGDYAIASARRALDLDPMSPVANVDLAWAYLLTRDYSRALEQSLNIREMNIEFPLARVYLSQVYQCLGQHDAAIRELELAVRSQSDARPPMLAMLGAAYGLGRADAAAREVLRRMKALARDAYVSSYDWAVLYTGLGHLDQGLGYLRRAFDEQSPRVIWLAVEPAFDRLRESEGFEELILRLNLG